MRGLLSDVNSFREPYSCELDHTMIMIFALSYESFPFINYDFHLQIIFEMEIRVKLVR